MVINIIIINVNKVASVKCIESIEVFISICS